MTVGRTTHQPDLDYWLEPLDKLLTAAYWHDPEPHLQGMLTAEHIVGYHEKIGGLPPDAADGHARGMIRPFQSTLLKSAGYELTLGARCLVQGERLLLTEREPSLIIPKNSVVYVSMQQVLCLPHYLVARFNLTIDLVYRGLLLGTGPQVDPGYQGALSCPLHNISSEEIEICLGQPFAKMDFVKTVPRDGRVALALSHIATEDELTEWLARDAPPNVRLFKGGQPPWREPIYGYLNGRRPVSSLKELSNRVAASTRTVNRLRRFSVVGLLGVALGIAALILAAFALTDGLSTVKQELQTVRACQQALTAAANGRAGTSATRDAQQLTASPACARP